MNKKKILVLAMTLSMVAILAIGGTIAYFTDTDKETNVFTTGNVDIDLIEEFQQNSKLMPGIDVTKKVDVKNMGSEDAYVRVHLAFPAILDSGDEDQPQFAAYNNTLHWNMATATMAQGKWNWHKTNVDGTTSYGPGYPGNGGAWNEYQQTIDGVVYNVYVATYETALKKGETADDAIYKVYLDKGVTNEQLSGILAALKIMDGETVVSEGIKVLVAAEGGQVDGFDNAYDALNTQFGVPGTYNPFN